MRLAAVAALCVVMLPVATACEDGAKARLTNGCAKPIWVRAASPRDNLDNAPPEKVLPGRSTRLIVQGNDFWFAASPTRSVVGAPSRFHDGERVAVTGDRCP